MQLEEKINDYIHLHCIQEETSIVQDLISSICGKHLGSGTYRMVFNYNLDDNYVVKLETPGSNCNVVEYMMWDEIQYLKEDLAWVKEWFAPVKWMSPNGRVLVMRKTLPKPKKKRPDKVPKMLWDVKQDNFGWIGNKFVCHDYGQFYNFIDYKKGLKKAVW